MLVNAQLFSESEMDYKIKSVGSVIVTYIITMLSFFSGDSSIVPARDRQATIHPKTINLCFITNSLPRESGHIDNPSRHKLNSLLSKYAATYGSSEN